MSRHCVLVMRPVFDAEPPALAGNLRIALDLVRVRLGEIDFMRNASTAVPEAGTATLASRRLRSDDRGSAEFRGDRCGLTGASICIDFTTTGRSRVVTAPSRGRPRTRRRCTDP